MLSNTNTKIILLIAFGLATAAFVVGWQNQAIRYPSTQNNKSETVRKQNQPISKNTSTSTVAATTSSQRQHATSSTHNIHNATNTPNPVKRVRNINAAEYIEVVNSCGSDYEGDCLNVRSQPSTDSAVVTQSRNGMVLKVERSIRANGRLWFQVHFAEWLRYPDRVTSDWYVAGEFVRPLQAPDVQTDTPKKKATETNKRIIVDLSEQTLYAYADDQLFLEQTVSTGLPLYPTPRGSFPIYKMTPSRYMQGPIKGITDERYDLPGVPWNLYFTYQGAVIHGAYWHDKFGQHWSHGCVNLPPHKAKQLYQWAELGTQVVVRD